MDIDYAKTIINVNQQEKRSGPLIYSIIRNDSSKMWNWNGCKTRADYNDGHNVRANKKLYFQDRLCGRVNVCLCIGCSLNNKSILKIQKVVIYNIYQKNEKVNKYNKIEQN